MAASSFPKARRWVRRPVLFASIQIGNEAQGLILNGSEGGICAHITTGTVGPGIVDLRFQSARTGHPPGWVTCRGNIVWTSNDRTVAGIEFVDPSPETNREIGNWLSFGESLRELRKEWPPGPPEQEPPSHWADHISEPGTPPLDFPAEPFPGEVGPLENAAYESEPEQLRTGATTFGQSYEDAVPRSRILWMAIVALVVLVGTVVLMRLYGPGWNFRNIVSKIVRSNQSRETDHATPSPATNAAIPTPQPIVPPPAPPPPPTANAPTAGLSPTPVPVPHGGTNAVASTATGAGLTLQAGAMTEEQNAKEMAQSLQQKHFPAFVYKKEGDRFYRVFIGPYASDQSLRQAQAELRNLNIPTIKKKSAP